MSVTSSPVTPVIGNREPAAGGRAARRGLVRYGYWWWTLPALVLTGTVI